VTAAHVALAFTLVDEQFRRRMRPWPQLSRRSSNETSANLFEVVVQVLQEVGVLVLRKRDQADAGSVTGGPGVSPETSLRSDLSAP
jgi:hypothetical protein